MFLKILIHSFKILAMKKFLLLTALSATLASTAILAQRTTPIKTVDRPKTARTEPHKRIEPPTTESGVPTLARPLEGHLIVKSIDNFDRSPIELPKGLTASRIENGLPRWIEGALPSEFKAVKTTEERALQYVAAIGKAMTITNPSEEFEIIKTETDDIGQTHVRMCQKLGDVPVYGSVVIAHEVNGKIQRLNGAYFPTPSVKSLIPTLAATAAHANVRAALGANKPFSDFTEEQKHYIGGEQLRSSLVIFHKNDDPTAERLAYHVIAYPNVLHRYEYLVDAENGAILNSFSASCSIAGHNHEDDELKIKNSKLKIEGETPKNDPHTERYDLGKIKNSKLKIEGETPKNDPHTEGYDLGKIKHSELKIEGETPKNDPHTEGYDLGKIKHSELKIEGETLGNGANTEGATLETSSRFPTSTTLSAPMLNDDATAFHPSTRLVLDGVFTATAVDLLGVSRTINTYQVGTTYYMLDASRPMFKLGTSRMPSQPDGGIETRDYNNTDDGPFVYVRSTNNAWNSPASVSAHYNGGVAYAYFRNTFNRKSIDNQDGTITSFINVTDERQSMDNAYWNGEAMFYGNGGSVFSPLARGLDVAGHEMTHGVVQSTANLRYQSEPGALNESFADVFGAMIDRDDWQIGEDVVKNRTTFVTGFLRDMANPNNGGTSLSSPGWQPKQVSEKYNGTQDNGGVHINSGIPNRAFYLFANNASVGKVKAEQVYYRTLTQYLVASSNFLDCRASVERACADLYAGDAALLAAAQTAFATVGIGGAGSSGGSGGSSTGTVYQQDLTVNPGADYVVYLTDNQAKLQLLNVSSGAVTTLSSRGIGNKPSVSDNGREVYYIGADKKMYRVAINYTAGTFTDSEIDGSPNWNNVAVSKDGKKVAGNEGDSLVWIYSYDLATWRSFKLYNPTFSQGVNSDIVKYSDVLEWDHFGESVVYDAFNSIPSQTGDPSEFWNVGFVTVWNNASRNWATGQVENLFTSLPVNTSVANPTFAKNSPYIVAFDFIDDQTATTVYKVRAANIQTGKLGTAAVFNNNALGYPSYSRTDNRMLISNNVSATVGKLVTVPLAATKIDASSTTPTDIRSSDAFAGVWFANGARTLATDELDKTAVSVSPNPFTDHVSIDIKSDISVDGKVDIMNLLGQSVSSTPLSILSGNNTISVKTSDLSSGTYLLKVTVGGKSRAIKIVKF